MNCNTAHQPLRSYYILTILTVVMALLDNHKQNDTLHVGYKQTSMTVGLHKPIRHYDTDTTETRNTEFSTSRLQRCGILHLTSL